MFCRPRKDHARSAAEPDIRFDNILNALATVENKVIYKMITVCHDEACSTSETKRRQPKSPELDNMLKDTTLRFCWTEQKVSECFFSNITVTDHPEDFFRGRMVCVMMESCDIALVTCN